MAFKFDLVVNKQVAMENHPIFEREIIIYIIYKLSIIHSYIEQPEGILSQMTSLSLQFSLLTI